MFDCCSRKKPSKTSLADQLQLTNEIHLSLSDKINLTFDDKNKRWKSNDGGKSCNIVVNLLEPMGESKGQARPQPAPAPAQQSNISGSSSAIRSQSPSADHQRLRRIKEESQEA